MKLDELQGKLKTSLEELMSNIKDDAKEYAQETAKDLAELVRLKIEGSIEDWEFEAGVKAIEQTAVNLAAAKGYETQERLLSIIFFGLKIAGGIAGG